VKRIVFLASGGGGNLIFLYHAMKLYLSEDFAVIGVIADRDCRALELGKKLELHSIRVSYSREYSSELVQALRQLQPDYIVTNITGFLMLA
jgi:folate-dependent phosphoribosylglycinamide formyltransferase PurN